MKKKNVILLVGIISLTMLGGCGPVLIQESISNIKKEEVTTEETEDIEEETEIDIIDEDKDDPREDEISEEEETTQETETSSSVDNDFRILMDDIYIFSDISEESLAEDLKDFAFKYGAGSTSMIFESYANDWFEKMENGGAKDARVKFNTAFEKVTSTAESMDETLEYDVAYLNVINGIKNAIGDVQEETVEKTEKIETKEEKTETATDTQSDISTIMSEIYKVNTGLASADTVAENFKNYAFKNGAPSTSRAFESMASEWFDTMKNKEGKDIRGEFSAAFNKVTTTAQSKDETLEYDVAYLNVVNGILAAIGDIQEETKTEETTNTNTGEENEFTRIMSEIYKVNTGAASADTVAENFKKYAFENGAPSTSRAFESMATEWFDTMESKEGKDIRAEFSEAFNTVTTTALSKDETLEFDVAYLNVVNGIFAAIGQ